MKNFSIKFRYPKKPLLLLLFQCVALFAMAGNVLVLHNTTGNAESQVSLGVSINNDDPFVAFQFELQLPDQMSYVNASIMLNPDRITDHDIMASDIGNNKILVVAYSPNNTPFTGNSGLVASMMIELGTVPGNYSLTPENAIIGNASSQNILTGVDASTITIQCPDIHSSATSLDFGEVILGQHSTRNVTLYNNGNQNLDVSSITFDEASFSVVGNTSFTISAGSQQSLSLRFDATTKGTYNNVMQVFSNDPDEAVYELDVSAYAYAVNEMHTGDMFGYSGNDTVLMFTINNMEPFIGFQFDLTLPSPLAYINGSVELTERAGDHFADANMVSSSVLRVVALSPSNQSFSGNDGEIISLDFEVDGTGGYYNLNISNVIIADATQGNIISDFSHGQLEVAAPDIHCNSSVNFGDVAINATGEATLSIYNYGSDTLKMTGLNFLNEAFSTDLPIPVNTLVNQHTDMDLEFQPVIEGAVSSQLQILSNDPDEYPKVINLSANVFMPNYLSVADAFAEISDTVSVLIEADNYEEFVGFQLNLDYPSYMTCLTDSTSLTDRAQDHSVFCSTSGTNQVLVFAYSGQQLPFQGNSGAIAELRFAVEDSQPGTDNLTLSNVIMGDANSENILYESNNGQITTYPNMSVEVYADETDVCAGSGIQLSAVPSGGSNSWAYSWSSNPEGFNSSVANPTATPAETTTYTVEITDQLTGNTIRESIEITVQPLPTVDAGENAIIYPGQSYQLSGSAGHMSTVLWSTAGDGTFENANTVDATYHPGDDDEINGSVALTLLANPVEPCNNSDDDVITLTIDAFPTINATVFLEGPFETTEMNTALNQGGYIPLSQPFNDSPWNYNGQESVAVVPNTDIVDWVLLEVRATDGDASTATSDKIIWQEAGFLMKNGRIRTTDGIADPRLDSLPDKNLYLVIHHRNHLAIMSSQPLVLGEDSFTYDFTTAFQKFYGGINGCRELAPGIYGMIAGDADANGQVQNQDKNEVWKNQFGLSGYRAADLDLNGQVQNQDKNEIWYNNFGFGSQIQN